MRIGELAGRTESANGRCVTTSSNVCWSPIGCQVGNGSYSERVVDRVIHIQELLAAGLHSTTISTLRPCMRDGGGGHSADATPRLITTLDAEHRRLDRAICKLTTARDVVDDVINAAAADGPGT